MRRIKRFLPIFCLILALVCTDVSAEGTVTASGSCGDNLAWELSDNGVLTIAGTGNMFDYNGATGGPWSQHAESITSVVVEEGVTGIGSWAFTGCRYVTSIQIPDSVTSIGGGVFRSCNLLENIVIGQNNQNYCDIGGVLFDKTGDNLICYPSGKQEAAYTVPSGVEHIRYDAFRECSALESVTLPDSLISLGFGAFYDCRSLTSITIPLNLQSIGGTVFSNCSSLTEITVAEGNTCFESVDGVLFSVDGAKLVAYPAGKSGNTYSIPAEVSVLESGAFGGCISLEKVVIPTGVTEIGAQMFENCSALKEVEMPSGITVIRDNAFAWCTGITSLTIPAGVTGIEGYAFYKCGALTEITIPNSVQSVGEAAFAGCKALSVVNYDGNEVQWGKVTIADYNSNLTNATICFLQDSPGSCGENLTWTLFEGVLTISGEGEMYDYSGENPAPWNVYAGEITAVSIGEDVTSIGEWAFVGCSTLETVTIPVGITDIGFLAFLNCHGLTEINVAEGNQFYSSVDGVLFKNNTTILVKYPSAKSAESYTIPAGVTKIDPYAFASSVNLVSVTIADSVRTIGWHAFVNCSGLTSIHIPAGVETIGTSPFTSCARLAEITVAEENAHYVAEDNVLFTADKSLLVQCACGKTETAYSIPAGVQEIGYYAFDGYTSLETLEVPASVVTIGIDAFRNSNLTNIRYAGSAVKWNKITVESGNEAFTDATVEFAFPSGTCGENLVWELIDGMLTISGEGEMTDFARDSDAPWYEYKSSVKSVVIEHGVTSIGTNAFNGYNTNLKSLTMADSITVIGDAAFNSCVWLSGELNLPDELVTIGDDAFSNCYRMTGVLVIPGKVTTIGKGAFYNTKLSGEVTLPNGLRQIGISAFEQCSQITSVRIPNTVTDIGDQAFFKCTALSYVYIPAAVQTMGERVFNLSTALKKVGPVGGGYNIEYGWTDAIPDNAFKGNTNIVSVTLPGTLTNIGASAFEGCSKLASIVIPNNVRNMGEYAFKGCSSLSSVTLGSGLTELSADAFSGCGLTAVTIPGNITAIGNSAFSGCRQLERVTLEKGIQTIEKEAFTNCVSLVEIILPDTITSVGDYAFSSLERVCIQGGPLATGNAAFNSAAVLYFFDSELWNGGWLDGDNKWIDGRYQEGVTVKWGEDLGNENWEIHAIHAPEFTIQPQSKNVSEGEIVTFTVAITGTPTPSVQWQVNAGNGWGNIPGAVDTSYTISAVAADEHGNRYRCVLVNYGGRTVSNVAEISLIVASGPCGDNLTWTLTADGILTITGTGSMWDFTLETLATWYQYRALIKELVISTGVTRIGAYAFYQCFTSASVTRAIVPGETVGITIGADVESIGECAFGACDTMQSVAFEGEQAPVLAEDAIPESVTLYHEGSDETWGNETTKNYNTVVMEMPKVETSPDDATVAVGKTVTFTAEFTGTPVASLQWQVCEDGQTWDDIRGATNATYTISSAGASLNQVMYRCVATNAAGTAISEAATLSISDVGIVATKTAVTNGILVSVSVGNPFENVKSGAVVCAVYEENGKLLGIATAALTVAAGEDMTTSLTVVCNAAQAAEVKVFFVTTDTYSPICNAEEIA